MEFEQIIKRLDWLDEGHRKDKTTLEALKEQMNAIEGEMKGVRKKVKELSSEMSRLATTAGRIEQFDTALTQHRQEITLFIGDIEKRRNENQTEIDKRYRQEFDSVNKTLADFKKIKEPINEIKREMKAFAEEEVHLTHLVSDTQSKMEEMIRTDEDTQRAVHLVEESRRQDSKRLADYQGELAAARKRLDEVREKTVIHTDNLRQLESRFSEILASESDRNQAQLNFTETQSRLQVERDRTWKDWQERFDTLTKQTDNLDTQLQSWDAAQRAVKRAQDVFEESTTKFERRINEITEIQRLAEDRSRQEWVTFKADDQKRWTSFTLSQDETLKDTAAEIKKFEEHITSLEDLTQTQQDILQQTKEANEQMLQALLAQIHELLSAYERIVGSTK